MTFKISLALILCFAACMPRHDPRVKEVLTLKTIRVTVDAAFSAHYTEKSKQLRQELKAEKKTYLNYLTRMHDLNLIQAEVVRLIDHIDRITLYVFNQIRTDDQDQEMLLYLIELVDRLVRVVAEAGVQLYE